MLLTVIPTFHWPNLCTLAAFDLPYKLVCWVSASLYTLIIALLMWLDRLRDTNPRLTRWSLALQPYSFEVIHRAGTDNTNADALSRIETKSLFWRRGEECKRSCSKVTVYCTVFDISIIRSTCNCMFVKSFQFDWSGLTGFLSVCACKACVSVSSLLFHFVSSSLTTF